MHELSLFADLMRKIEAVAREQGARRVVGVHVTLGALSHLSPAHFLEHFEQLSPGTVAEGARLEVAVNPDTSDPRAQEIVLDSVEVEVEDE
jgi:hydrogenase nickel incorporation protein HypA/HybF